VFKNKLADFRNKVRTVFNTILVENKISKNSFDRTKFIDRKRADKNLIYLQSGSGLLEQKEFDNRTILLFSEIEKILFNYLKKSKSPDNILENFVRLIKSQNFPSIWYNEFKDTNFLIALLKNLEYNKRGTEYLLLNKKAGEILLTRRVFNQINKELAPNLTLEELSFILSFQFTLRLSNFKKISESISTHTNFILNRFFSNIFIDSDCFVATLGSTATGSMTFNSDIDLLIVSINPKKSIELNKIISNKIEDLKKVVSPFSVDFRLRPEGKSSQLIWDIENYIKYLKSRARIWEFQALSKIRFVSGSIDLYDKFVNEMIHELMNRNNEDIKREILEMQKKISSESFSHITNSINLKKQNGGFLTLEFYLNYFIMTDLKLFKKSIGKNYYYRLKLLKNILAPNLISQLRNTFEELKKLEITLQVVLNTRNSILPEDKEKIRSINEFNRIKKDQNLTKRISELMKAAYRLIQLIK